MLEEVRYLRDQAEQLRRIATENVTPISAQILKMVDELELRAKALEERSRNGGAGE